MRQSMKFLGMHQSSSLNLDGNYYYYYCCWPYLIFVSNATKYYNTYLCKNAYSKFYQNI